jgi:hypothetical protein
MQSNAGMANRQGDVDLCFTQVSAPQLTLWLGLARRGAVYRLSSLALVQAVAFLVEGSSILSGEKRAVLCGKVVAAMWFFPHIYN